MNDLGVALFQRWAVRSPEYTVDLVELLTQDRFGIRPLGDATAERRLTFASSAGGSRGLIRDAPCSPSGEFRGHGRDLGELREVLSRQRILVRLRERISRFGRKARSQLRGGGRIAPGRAKLLRRRLRLLHVCRMSDRRCRRIADPPRS